MPLSNVRYSVPFGAITMRASWLLRIGPLVTEIGVEKVRAPSREKATCTGECPPNPLNCTHVTYTEPANGLDRKSTRLNSSHVEISYAVFCLKKKKQEQYHQNQEKKKKTHIK